ncbi:hypothetical protein BAUCODRAFT_61543 [Baudoinia panamericana UAMH 10762]|uniref:Cyclic nucleotide-binding domain-containing protein n=1 Tax=Baudoinia panamericana (strain UAMH 10762) TaxID=717646 RepID=M2NNJ1_BAUPA|nr:uncharacterized protein BAUCODRAFT_61543 [Baudoinia panamericana UAMH 10762]EMD01070.1 hypothetical protein BAUCODRAFT_61543 [Baudoinia panamericana UAMH 10762]
MSGAQRLPFREDEAFAEQASGVEGSKPIPKRASKFGRASSSHSTAGHSLPTRSFIHHANHARGPDEVQYASSGVREKTAELSSSFLSESEMARNLSPDMNHPPHSHSQSRIHGPIQEASEPPTPDGKATNAPAPSELTAALQRQPATEYLDSSELDLDRTSGHRTSVSTVPEVVINDGEQDEPATAAETTPLLPRERLSAPRKQTYEASPDTEEQPTREPGSWNRIGHQYPSLHNIRSLLRHMHINPKAWDLRKAGRRVLLEPLRMLPAVFLGLLLNLLDALSYGIILFPLGEEAFADLGPDGVSMFYVSCIISQLTYSTGSIFRGGVGSEMIEVVPFFHKMTYMIMAKMGDANPEALRATVIVSYCMSSIITGLVFAILGSLRLGTLVNFFPHSILTGCIGGVGIFLFITGIEVSARLEGNLDFSVNVLRQLFAPATIALWIPPLVLAIILLLVKRFYDRPWLVPAYYITITAVFYIITAAVPTISMDTLRRDGWVFEAPAAGVPFYNFYSYFKFSLVDWSAIGMTIPSQLALTFFGILHVPINVPNLAMVVQEDNVSINRELLMHGISNTLSGCVGSIQNYLVFVNSVLFMNNGGNSRLAGYLLAAATFGLWVAGPVVIGYVPVMVVGTLIYMLGIDLAQEALVATYGRLDRLEYITILVIALVMGVYDFVVGIGIGIGLACLVYVVQTSRKTVIRAEFTGVVAESTVRRHPRQRNYLHRVGHQIRVVKLGGYLFFGSIVKVEKKVRALIDAEAFAQSPIRYLVLDFTHVTGIDFSAAEAFGRMNRILHRREVTMALAGVTLGSDVGKSLQMVGLFVDSEEPPVPAPKVYEDLNSALEACENELLMVLTEKQKLDTHKLEDSPPMRIPEGPGYLQPSPAVGMVGSPRRDFLHQAATTTITEAREGEQAKWQSFKQPLPLLLQAFQDLTDKNEDFWFRATRYFTRQTFQKGQILYNRGDEPDGFYLLQSGILRAEYFLDQGNYRENIVAGNTLGELPFFSETERTSSVIAEQDCVAWLLTAGSWEELQARDPDVAKELLKISLKLSAERMNAITSYVLITAS